MCGVELDAGEDEKNVNPNERRGIWVPQIKGLEWRCTMAACLLEKVAAHLLAIHMGRGQGCEAASSQHVSVAKEPCPIV